MRTALYLTAVDAERNVPSLLLQTCMLIVSRFGVDNERKPGQVTQHSN